MIFFKYGFFVCFTNIFNAHFTSIQELKNIENLFINCHTSFFETLLKRVISLFARELPFLNFFLFVFFASSKSLINLSLLKFQYLSKNFCLNSAIFYIFQSFKIILWASSITLL
jgi:hypothetical protein